jgi:ABC-type bacteriocin/lantibiotic exporter with double-glycine peptidase domain
MVGLMNMKINHELQGDETGCGIACVAMITGATYHEVRQKMIEKKIIKDNSTNRRTRAKALINILGEYSEEFTAQAIRKKKIKTWATIPSDLAIASTNQNSKNKYYHWVVFGRDEVGTYFLGPEKSNKKRIRKFIGKKAGWFIDVSTCTLSR